MANNKEIKFSLAFTANTNEAIASLKRLRKELNDLATNGASNKMSGIASIAPEIQRATAAAGELQAKLDSAVNIKTGKLDLSIFSESLKKSGKELKDYAKDLNALGPQGRQAFANLAQAIVQAEAPLIRCSNTLKQFGTTLANTVRWQLSSSLIHGLQGGLQTAFHYAQE